MATLAAAKKLALAIGTVAAISTVTVAPAQARWHRGPGPGLAFGLLAGALTFGALAASRPYYYGYPAYYGYRYPAYYGYGYPAYYGGSYAYYGRPAYWGPRYYYGPRYHYRWHRWHHRHW